MKLKSPLVQMTMALVSLTGALLLMADLFFGVLPHPAEQTQRLRKGLTEGLAVQVATLLQNDDRKALQKTLDGVAQRTEGVRSLAVRRADGALVLQAGDHQRAWQTNAEGRASPDQLSVPLNSSGTRWGAFEITFRGDESSAWWQWLTQPLVLTLGFISIVGGLVFGLYIRRALQHLDPASVIPDRVQAAFDSLAEGVVVLDHHGRVLMANKSFRGLHPEAPNFRTGTALSSLPWLAASLADAKATPPWTRAMAEGAANTGYTLQLGAGTADSRQLVVNCAPITDAGGHVRGCLATFDDTTELHRANERLTLAMTELSASKHEIELKNEELFRLATRDPMTGCLNRRAFHEAFEPMLERARRSGEALSCLMLDIDHFKAVNDGHGHAIGDRVIQEVAKKLHGAARGTDLVCRYGGEEFVVVVPDLDANQAMEFAERVRGLIERECGPGVREVPGLKLTTSIGVSTLNAGSVISGHELVDRADQALYRAKREGRNRVHLYLSNTGFGAMDVTAELEEPA